MEALGASLGLFSQTRRGRRRLRAFATLGALRASGETLQRRGCWVVYCWARSSTECRQYFTVPELLELLDGRTALPAPSITDEELEELHQDWRSTAGDAAKVDGSSEQSGE